MTHPNHTPSVWNLFPWAIAGAMAVVVAVNIGMVSWAIQTFPGKAGRDGFDLSNRYNMVLDQVRAAEALGWRVTVELDGESRVVVQVATSDGAFPTKSLVNATARRPLGLANETRLALTRSAADRWVSDVALPAPGQWDVQLTITASGHEVVTTRRLIAP